MAVERRRAVPPGTAEVTERSAGGERDAATSTPVLDLRHPGGPVVEADGLVLDLRRVEVPIVDVAPPAPRLPPSDLVAVPADPFWRVALTLVLWSSLAVLAVWAVLGVLRPNRPLPIVWALSVTPLALLPAYPLVVVGLVRRNLVLAGFAAGIAAAHLWLVAPVLGPALAARQPAGPGQPLRLASANLYFAHPDVGQAEGGILGADADLVFLQELTPAHVARMPTLFAAYPHQVIDAREGAFGSAILSRLPLVAAEATALVGHPLTRAELELAEGRVEVWNIHPPAPRDAASHASWSNHLSSLAGHLRGGDLPLIVAGDFNATRWHPPFDELLGVGLADAHEAVGRGFAATWPADRPVPPFLRLDHVLVSPHLAVRSARELPAAGSDHRPVVVDLVVRPSP